MKKLLRVYQDNPAQARFGFMLRIAVRSCTTA
jgi:hypothetical protein